MTGSNILLDTNIVIDLFKGDKKIVTFLDEQKAIYIATTVLGELYLGAFRSDNEQKHLKQIEEFISRCSVIGTDSAKAESYGKVKATLLKKGKPIPENDIWIAATAMQYQLPLYTKDGHFYEVEGLI